MSDDAIIEREKLEFEKEKHARERWWHEDNLVNQRITWILSIHGIVGTAFGYVRYKISEVQADVAVIDAVVDKSAFGILRHAYLDALRELGEDLLYIGVVASITSLIGIGAAIWAQVKLQKQFPQYSLGVTNWTSWWGRFTALMVPVLLIIAWLMA